jgi:glutamine---fructose-6-phosphate transaminase (isomerizing)
MCGIIGYVGTRNAADVLLQGLSKLEYRGYDSAGVATLDGGRIGLLKAVGKLGALSRAVAAAPPSGSTGLGHTRWATHGAPSEVNAHPHTDCSGRVALAHNGIIENYQALRAELEAAGHVFKSQTDSEVLAHLVEDGLKAADDPLEALRAALRRVQGSYAVVLIDSRRPQELVAARNGSPLVLGLGEGENFAASDAAAILGYTRRVAFLGDYQVARVRGSSVRVSTLAGEDVALAPAQFDWDPLQTEKGPYPHYMLKEIHEQPRVLEQLLHRVSSDDFGGDLFAQSNLSAEDVARVRRVVITACGTSWHAGLAGKHFLESLAGLPTEVDVASEFRYRGPLVDRETLAIGISQSGETADTLGCLKQLRGRALKVLSICNVTGSSIPRESDGVLYTHAGPEIGVASTKCYTAQLATLLLLALRLARLRGVPREGLARLREELALVPGKMRAVLSRAEAVRAAAWKFADARDFLFLARGVNTATAFEGALKIKEIAYVHATGHPAGEMKHGPIALIDARMPVVCLLPASPTYEKMLSNVQEVRARGGRVIAVAEDGDEEAARQAEEVLRVPAAPEPLTPLLTALPLQLLAYFMAVKRGCDVDQPRNLAKSVTVE